MSEKSGRSEEKTDWLGNRYTQHYDADGNKCGWSEEKMDLWGNNYTQHRDEDNNKSGWSEEKEGILGNKYTQNHDEEGSKSGWSEEKTSLLGSEYTQHHDHDDNKHGWSEEKTSLFGNKYTQHYDTDDKRVDVAESNDNDEYNGNTGSDENNNYSTHLNNYSSSKNESSSGKKTVWFVLIFGITIAIILIIKTTNNKKQSPFTYDKPVSSQANKSVKESIATQNKKQPSNDNILNGDEVKTFIEKWVCLEKLDEIMPLYADKVDYSDKGLVDKAFIKERLTSLHREFPYRKYKLISSIKVIPGNSDNKKTAKYTIHFVVSNDQKTIEGDVYSETTLHKQGNRILVIREKGEIKNRQTKDNLDNNNNRKDGTNRISSFFSTLQDSNRNHSTKRDSSVKVERYTTTRRYQLFDKEKKISKPRTETRVRKQAEKKPKKSKKSKKKSK